MFKPQNGTLIGILSMCCTASFAASEGTAAQKSAVVGIASSTSSGSGVLILLDGQLRVLTNAHLVKVGERPAVHIAVSSEEVEADVEHRLDEDDILILRLPNSQSSNPKLLAVAAQTLSICSDLKSKTCKETAVARIEEVLSIDDRIVTANGGVTKVSPTQSIMGSSRKVRDLYISGNYDRVWLIKALVREGVSGGAFFKGDQFQGLVTKTSRGLQNNAFAIPVEEIGPKLRALQPTSPSAPRYPIQNSIRGSVRGGDPGNSGGDPETRTSQDKNKFWVLLQPGCVGVACSERSEVTNPFFDAQSGELTFIKRGHLFQAATKAQIQKLDLRKNRYELISKSPEAERELQSARLKKPIQLNFLRIWSKFQNRLRNDYPSSGSFTDGVNELYSIGLSSDLRFSLASLYPKIEIFRSKTSAYRINDDEILLILNSDLKTVSIQRKGVPGFTQAQAQPLTNASKRLYQDPSKQLRALMVYNDVDLSVLETVVVEVGDRVYEFQRQNPNLAALK